MAVLPCSAPDCGNDARWVVAETSPFNMLFPTGAALLCDKCSEEVCNGLGGIRLEMPEFAEAIRREQA